MILEILWCSVAFSGPSLTPSTPQGPPKNNLGGPQLAPLPRFACLKSHKVNMHVGPGKQYPTQWIYCRKYLPVEIIAEFDVWRQIRDHQGMVGWVHRCLLSGTRYGLVYRRNQPLRSSPQPEGKIEAYVEATAQGRLLECQKDWCKLEFQASSTAKNWFFKKCYRGWILRKELWGVYAHESKF